ncbi:MAG: GNAT family N-acetyltransferase [Magnetospirillum sp. WYHS-4]
MKIVALNPDRIEAWDSFAAGHPGAHLAHRAAWFSLVRETFGYESHGLALVDPEGTLVGGLPMFDVPAGRKLTSAPFRDRGGLLLADGIDGTPLLREARALADRLGRDLQIRQGEPLPVPPDGMTEARHWLTSRLDLTPGPEALWRALDNNAQGPVKQARRQGVAVRIGESAADMEIFRSLFASTRRRLGVPVFPPAFFDALHRHFVAPGLGRLLLAEVDGRPVAGLLLLFERDTALDGYAASLPGTAKTRANDLLVWTAIETACSLGKAVFDFGADSPRQTSLLSFKRKWGAQVLPLSEYWSSPLRAADPLDNSSPVYRLVRGAVSRLPFPVYEWASRLVVARYG